MKPIIGVNTDVNRKSSSDTCYTILKNYVAAIESAGGIPLLLPPMAKEDLTPLLKNIHGMLFIGGNDYSPSLYGEKPDETIELIDQERENFDLTLMNLCLNDFKVPILGICGGCQLLNISLNGSLIQDIPESNVKHGKHLWHYVEIEKNSKLYDIYKATRLNVPTNHHQAIKKLGHGLTISAYADDKIIEAIEITNKNFIIGVQWHPERDLAGNLPLFKAFIESSLLCRNK